MSAYPERDAIAGVNIGGTTTSVLAGTAGGTIRERRSWPTQARDGEALYASIRDTLRSIAPDVRAIGVAVGGPMNARSGVVVAAPHLPGLHGFPLRERLREDLERPVVVHHDAAACALAEYRWGIDREVTGLVYLTCGTGFGAGLVIDGTRALRRRRKLVRDRPRPVPRRRPRRVRKTRLLRVVRLGERAARAGTPPRSVVRCDDRRRGRATRRTRRRRRAARGPGQRRCGRRERARCSPICSSSTRSCWVASRRISAIRGSPASAKRSRAKRFATAWRHAPCGGRRFPHVQDLSGLAAALDA